MSTPIAAASGVVWRALTDLDRWPRWSRLVPRAEGELKVGEKLRFQIRRVDGSLRPHVPTLCALEPERKIVLVASSGGLVRIEHTFTLEELGSDTVLHQRWDTTGPLAAPCWPSLQRAFLRFEEFGADLARYAEGRMPRAAIIGAGPSGLTAALLLARAGHRVTVYDRDARTGGLWAAQLDDDGHYAGENSCKVYQSSYRSAPALLSLLGLDWRDHFVARHDLTRQWLLPFLAACTASDLRKLAVVWARHLLGVGNLRTVAVGDWVEAGGLSDPCQAWLRATALGGITGTLRMSMWELLHRFGINLGSIGSTTAGALYWNARPPNADGGFVHAWRQELDRLGVRFELGVEVLGVGPSPGGGVRLQTAEGGVDTDAAFLAVPPPALARLVEGSHRAVGEGMGRSPELLSRLLEESKYAHLGITWFFDRALPTDLPLGGHNVRRGWHPILVQHSQYAAWLRPPAVTAVVGSISLDTPFLHHRLGSRAASHSPEEIARILWADERSVDSSLPEAIRHVVYGVSSATQVVHHGPLPIQVQGMEIYLATHLNGHAPYFTASLEAAIQAGAAAAAAREPAVERLPTGPIPRRG